MEERARQIKKRLKNLQSLPTLPPVMTKLTKLLGDDNTTALKLAEVIEKDQVLTSKVLKMVNSAFYGFPRRISTVSTAIVLLGFNVIRTLIITASIFEMMQSEDLGLWEHSLGVAAASGLLAQHLELKNPEEVTTAGLLHDLGKVVIRAEFPDLYHEVLHLVDQEKVSFREAERRVLGLEHGEIGEFLTRRWNLPERLVEPIAFHHHIDKARKYRKETAVVQVADVLIRALGYGNGGDPWVPPLEERAWNLVRLKKNDLEELLPVLEDRLLELRFFTLEMQGLGFAEDIPAG